MKKGKIIMWTGTVFYIFSLTVFLYWLKIEFMPDNSVMIIGKITFYVLSALFLCIGSAIFAKYNKEKKEVIWHYSYIVLIVMYIVLLALLLIINEDVQRGFDLLFTVSSKERDVYLAFRTNLMPLKSIIHFLRGDTNLSIELINIMGNIIIFMPLTYLIIKYTNNTWNVKKILLFFSSIIIFFELTQLILMCGSFDIDDYILNILGVAIIYYVYNIIPKMVRKL